MKTYIIKAILFFSLLILIGNIPSIFLKKYYGNEKYALKHAYFQKNREQYNSIIVGSSRLFRHFNPVFFDSLMNKQSLSTFNLAAPATYNPEIYFLFENLLESVSPNTVKYIFVELQTLNNIPLQNLKTPRNYYWLNLKYLLFARNYFNDSKLLKEGDRQTVSNYIKSYALKNLNFQAYKYFFKKEEVAHHKILWVNNNGFLPLDEELKRGLYTKELEKRRADFLKDTSYTYKRIESSAINMTAEEKKNYLNETHLNLLKKFIERSEKKGIHLIYIIPPRLTDYRELFALKAHLPKSNVLDISDYSKYPQLYYTRYSFDTGHLNGEGAKLFTKFLAEDMQLIMNKN